VDSNRIAALIIALGRAVRRLLRPARSGAKLVIGAAGDLTRTRSQLMAENALLRQQLIVLRRRIERPRLHRDDRLLLLALARLTRRWRRLARGQSRDAAALASSGARRASEMTTSGQRRRPSSESVLTLMERVASTGYRFRLCETTARVMN